MAASIPPLSTPVFRGADAGEGDATTGAAAGAGAGAGAAGSSFSSSSWSLCASCETAGANRTLLELVFRIPLRGARSLLLSVGASAERSADEACATGCGCGTRMRRAPFGESSMWNTALRANMISSFNVSTGPSLVPLPPSLPPLLCVERSRRGRESPMRSRAIVRRGATVPFAALDAVAGAVAVPLTR
jgi:hypothetical protein